MQKVLRHFALLGCLLSPGCALLPEIAHQPTVHNPFPQLSKVAITPFFNLSTEKTVDGRQVALAYFNELQLVPGFEVVPLEVVEQKIRDHHLAMAGPGDARLLAQLLGVDAVVVGAVTDFCPYPPQRLTMQVEWYAANPHFHPIPPGYGLPWGTPEERDIPAPLVLEAEMALAKEQLKTQTPPYEKMVDSGTVQRLSYQTPVGKTPAGKAKADKAAAGKVQPASAQAIKTSWKKGRKGKSSWRRQAACRPTVCRRIGLMRAVSSRRRRAVSRGYRVPAICRCCAMCAPTTATTWSLPRRYPATITSATNPAGGWQGYLERSDDFIRFCCHMHISEMLSARGGAGETRVVWRWPTIR